MLIECRQVRKNYQIQGREIKVLENIDLIIPAGKITVISGRSGAGKSTLMILLGGLDQPSSGSVLFEGKPMETMSNQELATLRREKIGIIFQNFNLLTSWTALENVEAALMPTSMSETEQRQKARAMLEAMGLGDRLDNLPAELSVGQQQRVAIARTLVNNPQVILADEPIGDVDEETGKEILEKLIQPVKQRGVALVVATHGLFPLQFADQVFQMKDGVLAPKSCLDQQETKVK